MSPPAALPADYVSWSDDGGLAVARHDVAPALRAALSETPSLYAWAAARPGREVFHGRGETFAVTLGGARVVVRHAQRGGMIRRLLHDRFLGRTPRFVHEIVTARRLHAAGIRTPAVLAGVAYRGFPFHTADVVTERFDGPDLAALLFGADPPAGERRQAVFEAVGRMVRRLHQAGFVHPDLQLRNVLILEAGSTAAPPHGRTVEAALLDVDTCEERSRHDHRAHHANVRRFLRSWDKWNRRAARLTAQDLQAFKTAYDPALRL